MAEPINSIITIKLKKKKTGSNLKFSKYLFNIQINPIASIILFFIFDFFFLLESVLWSAATNPMIQLALLEIS